MSHHISIVDDDALPEGHDFVFVNLPTGPQIFYRRGALSEGPLEDSWAAYRAVTRRRPPSRPTVPSHERGQVIDLTQRRREAS